MEQLAGYMMVAGKVWIGPGPKDFQFFPFPYASEGAAGTVVPHPKDAANDADFGHLPPPARA